MISVARRTRWPGSNTVRVLMLLKWGTIQGTCKVIMQMNRKQRPDLRVRLFLRRKKVKAINQRVVRAARNPQQRRATVQTPNLISMTVNQRKRAANKKSLKYIISANPVNPIPQV